MAPTLKYDHLSSMDPSFAAIQKVVDEQSAKLWPLPLDQIRAALVQTTPLPGYIPKDLIIEDQTAPVPDGSRIGLRIYKARTVSRKALLFYVMHGGGENIQFDPPQLFIRTTAYKRLRNLGWVVGSHGMEEGMNRLVAAKHDAVVVSVDYRMAPEFRFPYAVNDSFDVLLWCKANAKSLGIDSERIIIGGSSAGGNLAAVLSLKARNQGITGIIGQVLNIPVTCHPSLFPVGPYELNSWEQNKDASLLNSFRMKWFWDHYLPDPSPDEYHSPLLARSFKGLPPALVQVAGLDPLRDEGLAYAEALKTAGVDVSLSVYPGLPHGFAGIYDLPATKAYLYSIVDWIGNCSKNSNFKARI